MSVYPCVLPFFLLYLISFFFDTHTQTSPLCLFLLLSPLLSVFLALSFSHLQARATRTHSHSHSRTDTQMESPVWLGDLPCLKCLTLTRPTEAGCVMTPAVLSFFLPDVSCRVWAKCPQAVRPSETTEMQWMRKTISLLGKKLPSITSTSANADISIITNKSAFVVLTSCLYCISGLTYELRGLFWGWLRLFIFF